MSEKFHRAAEDGYLSILKEATKRDCNHPDEDGMTPTACAAYAGKLDALRLLVGRGGDPERCDYFGNTSLHCAAARGHLNCVSFLVNFGVNIWAMDNEYHSAKDLAAINNKEEILRYLDLESAKQEKEDPKSAKKLQEKAKKDAEKRQKEYDKIQKKADKKRKEEEEKLQKEREKINNLTNTNKDSQKKGILSTISKNSLGFISSNKPEPKVIHSKSVHKPTKFSELTQSSVSSNKKTIGGIQRKLLRKKINSENKNNSFKVRATILQVQGTESDCRKSVRNLSGLQRDSEIIFVPNGSMSSTENESPLSGKRGKISDVFRPEDYSDSFYGLIRSKSEPDFGDYKFGSQRASIFERPGFGSVAFRNSLTATLSSVQGSLSEASELSRLSSDGNADTSLDSHGSPAGNRLTPWEEEDLPSDEEEEPSQVYLFLAANGLENYMPLFTKEHIDLEALMLLNDQDLESLKLPLGPRRKLLRALNDRRLAFEDPGEVTDIRL